MKCELFYSRSEFIFTQSVRSIAINGHLANFCVYFPLHRGYVSYYVLRSLCEQHREMAAKCVTENESSDIVKLKKEHKMILGHAAVKLVYAKCAQNVIQIENDVSHIMSFFFLCDATQREQYTNNNNHIVTQ